MITDCVGTRTNEDPTCPICRKPVEIQHTPFRDTITGTLAHDYCFRTETPQHFQARRRDAIASGTAAVYGPLRWA